MPFYIPTRLDRLIDQSLSGEHDHLANRHKEYLPNFIVIGAAKSATTSLAAILRKHSQIHFSSAKEPKFFGRNYVRGWSWYARFFESGKNMPLRGEASTMYTSANRCFRHTPHLIKHHLGDIKLIYLVRNPLQRLISHWRHYKGRHSDCPDLDQILKSRLLKNHILGSSLYFHQLKRYLDVFPSEMIYCLTYEELTNSPKKTLLNLFEFLEIRKEIRRVLRQGKLPKRNIAGSKGRELVDRPTLKPHLKMKILEIIKPDAEQMLSYMGSPLDTWDFAND